MEDLQAVAQRVVADHDLLRIVEGFGNWKTSLDTSTSQDASRSPPLDQPWPADARCTTKALQSAEERVVTALSHLMTQVRKKLKGIKGVRGYWDSCRVSAAEVEGSIPAWHSCRRLYFLFPGTA